MPTFKNLYRMPVTIYFGDLAPDAIFYYDEIHQHIWIGRDDYGCFTKKQFQEIKESWDSWRASHRFDPIRYRWYEKSEHDSRTTTA